ncbi:hypothetical protein M9H77_15931 [Catharanthus roseus]|uniref:Uncharacterized protein n=1 Tax=Catharanthus roseus TaxID=4058 RepID=A0ACC0B0T6_CATRO|nr:hypothetical protein M9H77_15931 [Catharanthus roseus]
MSRKAFCNCGTLIAEAWYGNFHFYPPDRELGKLVLCGKCIKKNVYIDKEIVVNATVYKLNFIKCARCDHHIGYKFVEGPGRNVRHGNVLLFIENVQREGILPVIEEEEEEVEDDVPEPRRRIPTEEDLERFGCCSVINCNLQ